MPVTLMTISAVHLASGQRVILWLGHNSRTPEGTDRLVREAKQLHAGYADFQVAYDLPDGARWEDDEDDLAEPQREPDLWPEPF